MIKRAATEFSPTAPQGKAWGGSAAFRSAKGARQMLYRIRKANPELSAKQAFQQLYASADPKMFKGWTTEDMNLFIDRYVTNDPHQKNYREAGKLFSKKRGQLFNRRSALEEDLLRDKPLGSFRSTLRTAPISLISGAVSGATFVPELLWSGSKALGRGLAGRGWKYRASDWNPFDDLLEDPSVADYKTFGKSLQRGANSAAGLTGMVLPALFTAGAPAGTAGIRAGTKSAFRSGLATARGGSALTKPGRFVAGYTRRAAKNVGRVADNTAKILSSPKASIQSFGRELGSRFKAAPIKTTLSAAAGLALGPGFVLGDMLADPPTPMNDYRSFEGGHPSFDGAVDSSGKPVYS